MICIHATPILLFWEVWAEVNLFLWKPILKILPNCLIWFLQTRQGRISVSGPIAAYRKNSPRRGSSQSRRTDRAKVELSGNQVGLSWCKKCPPLNSHFHLQCQISHFQNLHMHMPLQTQVSPCPARLNSLFSLRRGKKTLTLLAPQN